MDFQGILVDFQGILVDFQGILVDFQGILVDFQFFFSKSMTGNHLRSSIADHGTPVAGRGGKHQKTSKQLGKKQTCVENDC